MREYLARRLLLFLLTLLVASLVIFVVTRILPGDQVAEDTVREFRIAETAQGSTSGGVDASEGR